MAKRTFSNPSWTTAPFADTTTMTANNAGFIKGASGTQRTRIHRLTVGGLAAASAPNTFMFGRDSTVAVTSITLGTNGKDAFDSAASAALAAPPTPGFSATTMPQRDTALGGLITFAINLFGGFYQWITKDDEIVDMIGNTPSLGELSLSAFTGSTAGLCSSNIVYETD